MRERVFHAQPLDARMSRGLRPALAPQYLLGMAGLTATERERLEDVVGRRIGYRADAKTLVAAYLAAMERNAFARTVEVGPVPTSLTAERSAVLIEISRQLKRVIEDFEIQALFRVTAAQARSMRTTLLATYSDDADDLTIDWSLIGAKNRGRRHGDAFTGTAIEFTAEDRRDAFVASAQRVGVHVELVLGEPSKPWMLIVGDEFPSQKLPSAGRS